MSSGDGYYRLLNRHSGKVVDIWGWSTEDGAEVNQFTDLNGDNQQFRLTGANNDQVTFINRYSQKALEVWEWSLADGGDISQFTPTGGANQQWRLVPVSGGGGSGIVGWATQNGGTTGGGSGPVVNVSSASQFLSAINSGTTQTVRLTASISISGMNPVASNKTIVGAGSGVTISGGGLTFNGDHNVIVRNIHFTGSDDDCINVEGGSTNIWIHHNSFSNAYDGAVDIKRASDFITVSWNRFFNHGKTMLLGHSDDNASQDVGHLRVTYHHNYFDGTDTRHPRVRFGNPVHVFNNYYRDNEYGVASTMDAGVLVEGNYFESVDDPTLVGYAASGPGTLVQRNNVFVNSGSPESAGSVASIPYGYSLDSASSIPSIVVAGAGVGHLSL